ncbi:hypothetical protein BDR03DRAFT_954734 [Suillus americanus]|nr:hypothetical protein BDR03DRAFT_954734 [Suillus americanus]
MLETAGCVRPCVTNASLPTWHADACDLNHSTLTLNPNYPAQTAVNATPTRSSQNISTRIIGSQYTMD